MKPSVHSTYTARAFLALGKRQGAAGSRAGCVSSQFLWPYVGKQPLVFVWMISPLSQTPLIVVGGHLKLALKVRVGRKRPLSFLASSNAEQCGRIRFSNKEALLGSVMLFFSCVFLPKLEYTHSGKW